LYQQITREIKNMITTIKEKNLKQLTIKEIIETYEEIAEIDLGSPILIILENELCTRNAEAFMEFADSDDFSPRKYYL
jgi:hypothetical protein